MTNLIFVPQMVNGRNENILINPSHIERIVPNTYDENQVIVLFTTGVKIHVSMQMLTLCYTINSLNDRQTNFTMLL